jgi:hypothetical protein
MKRYSFKIIVAGIKEDIQGICNWLEKDDEYCKDLREKVKTYESKFQVLAAWLYARGVEPEEYVLALKKYIDSRRLDPSKIKVSKNAIQINDDIFEDKHILLSKPNALKFTEYIHANYPVMEVEKSQDNIVSDVDVPVVSNEDNSIQIFEINDANDGRRLVGNDTNWCIGYSGPNNMWQSYRDSHDASFFVVVDNNPPTPEQRKVAIDFTGRSEVLLTDIPNRTGRTLSNGMDWNDYSGYLRSKGINLRATRENPETGEEELILKNKPRSPEETIQSAVFNSHGTLNMQTLKEWQSGLSEGNKAEFRDDFYDEYIQSNVVREYARGDFQFKNSEAKYYTSRWMSLGKSVDPEVVDFLMNSVGGIDILSKYVNTGMEIKDSDIYEKIKSNKQLFASYLRSRVNAAEQSPTNLNPKEFTDLKEFGRKDLFLAYVNTGRVYFPDIQDDLELARLHLQAKLEKNFTLSYEEVEYVFFVDRNEDRLIKVLEQGNQLSEERYNAIKDNPKLLLIALSKAPMYNVIPHWIKDARTRIFSLDDENLVKAFAIKYGFSADEIKLAKQYGFENAAKFTVLMRTADSEIVELFDPKNPDDVSILNQLGQIDLVDPFLYDERWGNSPVLSWAKDLSYAIKINNIDNTLDDGKTVNYEMLPETPIQMLLFFIIHSGQMPLTVFQDYNYELEEEDKENLRRVYLEFNSAINNLDFWHDFIKQFPKFQNNSGMADLSTYFMILRFIPEQFLEDDTVLDFIGKNNILNQNKSYFLNKINFSEHPKLLDLLVEKSKNNFSETLRSLGQGSKDAYIEKALEKNKQSIKHLENIGNLLTRDRFNVVEVYLNLYPEERDRLHKTNPDIITYLLYGKVNLNYQLWLLRNIPEAVKAYILTTANLKDFAPEVRASMKQMFPALAYKIDFYEQNKYGTGGYFDEDTEEVVQAPRPAPKPMSDEEMAADLQKMFVDPFDPDDEDEEEEELVVASVNLMVKIAQKLDFKKEYRLADKLTYILTKKI